MQTANWVRNKKGEAGRMNPSLDMDGTSIATATTGDWWNCSCSLVGASWYYRDYSITVIFDHEEEKTNIKLNNQQGIQESSWIVRSARKFKV